MSCVFRYPDQPDVAISVAALVVAWSMPFLWLRRRGWRILAQPEHSQPRDTWQFTIGDLLVATTQAGAFFALLLASAAKFQRGELVVYLLLLLAAPAVVLIALAWRRFWQAVLICLVLAATLTVLPIWGLAANFQLSEVALVLAIVGVGVVSLLAAAGWLRWAGYGLR
jgi:hypothetical protein